MRIKFITEEGLLAAKANYAVIYKEILKKKATDLPTLFNDSGIIRDSSIEIEEFSLICLKTSLSLLMWKISGGFIII